jgi:uncharacterized membrane protein
MEALRELLFGVSAQRPEHSLFIAGEQLPIEARMGGIFVGFGCGVLILLFLGRLGATSLPSAAPRLACIGLVGLTGLDGLNAVLFDAGAWSAYPPSNAARLLTGLGAGYGLSLLAVPSATAAWSRSRGDDHAVVDLVELAFGLVVVALVGGLLLSGAAPLLWPAVLAMLAGLLAGFGTANVVLLGALQRRRPPLPVTGLLVAALGLALVEVAGLGALRSYLLAAFGFTWGL